MHPVDERVGVLVLRVTVQDEPTPHDVRIQITTVDILPPIGEPAELCRQDVDGVEAALEIVSGWLAGAVTRP